MLFVYESVTEAVIAFVDCHEVQTTMRCPEPVDENMFWHVVVLVWFHTAADCTLAIVANADEARMKTKQTSEQFLK
jgi:hypothetical protein